MNKDKNEVKTKNINIKEDIKIKKPTGRPKKSDIYKDRREEVLKKVNNILGITETNKIFYLVDIDENKRNELLKLKDEVGVCFSLKDRALFAKELNDRTHISLIKIVYKEMNISLTNTTKTVSRNGKSIKTSSYLVGVE